MKKDGIAVVGRLARGAVLLDGQTVKTKTLYDELRREFPGRQVLYVDVYRYRKRILPILWDTLRVFASCEHIIVLLSKNGHRFFFPVLHGLNLVFRRKLYHDVIGGALPMEAAESASLRRRLGKFQVNWVEFPAMKQELEQAGVHNVEVLPNFKRLEILSKEDVENDQKNRKEPFLFLMFSRVIKEKGIETAAEAVANANRRFGRKRAALRIYGPVDAGYRQEFEQLLERYRDCVSYCGCVPSHQSVSALRGGYMLLFPSVYPGEGMPGTILDAFSAGLPVAASDWRFNRELVRDGETGYCYDWRNPGQLEELVVFAVEHPGAIDSMRKNCLAEAGKYTPQAAMEQIRRSIEGDMEGERTAKEEESEKKEASDSSTLPLVSVIITTYRNEAYLPRAVESVLAQTYPNIQLIVVDDNPPDSIARKNTEAVMERYPQAVYRKHPRNRNGAAARNTGIRAARGKYLAFLDNDDIYFRSHIADCVAALEARPECGAAVCRVVKVRDGVCWEMTKLPGGDMARALLLSETALGTGSNLFVRTELARQIGGFDESFCRHQDVEFGVRIFSRCAVAQIPKLQIVKEMGGHSNMPGFEKFAGAKRQLSEKFSGEIGRLTREEQDCYYAGQYGALLYAACREGNRQAAEETAEQLKQYRPLSRKERLYLQLANLGCFPVYEWGKGLVKRLGSGRVRREAAAGLDRQDKEKFFEILRGTVWK